MPTGIFRHAMFDVTAICRLASSCRQGIPCSCDATQTPADGSLYWVIFLVFNDGVEWAFRSPRHDGAIRSEKTIQTLLASEAATLKYIKSHSTIPVPEVYSYSSSKENAIGVPYILMSKASGFPLSEKWKSLGSRTSTISLEERVKVLSQLGFITWQLSQLRFESIGSLFEENGHLQIKSCLSQGFVVYERDTLEELPRGPFASEAEYFDALMSGFLQHAECLQLNHHCFLAPCPTRHLYDDINEYRKACDQWNNFVALGSKIDGSENRVDYTIAGRFLREITSNWTKEISPSPPHNASSKRFPLHHPDLSVNNIFVDDNCNITCIIDWAFCSSVPLPVLLMAPGLPQARNELEAPLIDAFKDGLNSAINSDHGADSTKLLLDSIGVIPVDRFVWLLCRLASFDSMGDFHLFNDIWQMSEYSRFDLLTAFRGRQSFDHYLQWYEEMRQDDESEDLVRERDDKYFKRSTIGLTVARKLTLVSEWTSRYRKPDFRGIRYNGKAFVADDKLWKWILKALPT